MSRDHGPQAGHGFTLVELLAAMTLLALLLTAAFAGLRLGVRVWEAADARLDQIARVQIVQSFLRRCLTEALPMQGRRNGRAEAAGLRPLFRGTARAVRFAGLLPEGLGAGPYLLELAIGASSGFAGHRDLVLRWRPLDPPDRAGMLDTGERVLIENISGLELAYFGALDPKQPPEWQRRWEGRSDLPLLVRLRARFPAGDDRPWPELIVRPMIDPGEGAG